MAGFAELAPRLQQALLLDWDAQELRGPQFLRPDGVARKKLAGLVSPRSDAAVTWSVFRTLQRLPAQGWLPHVLRPQAHHGDWDPAEFTWWSSVPAPRSHLLWLLDHMDGLAPAEVTQQAAALARLTKVAEQRDGWKRMVAEGADRGDGVLEPAFEADLVITTPGHVVVVMGVYQHDIERRTFWDAHRDALARGLDTALELAGPDRVPWLLFVTDDYRHEGPETRAMAYEALASRYSSDRAFLAARLPSRDAAQIDRLAGQLRWLSWADLLDVVLDHSSGLPGDGRLMLRRLVDYLHGKQLLFKGG
ncbi:MAG: hypothetical protein EXR52_01420 [Dehalococcoidia bacterium]|nr:hypothetical protein [Dehalococcoidia bacterium]